MAASLKLLPGSTVRWRGRRYLIVDYQSLDAIIARQPGKRRLERIPVNEAAPDHASHIVSGRTPDLVSVPEKAWQTAVKRFEILKPLLTALLHPPGNFYVYLNPAPNGNWNDFTSFAQGQLIGTLKFGTTQDVSTGLVQMGYTSASLVESSDFDFHGRRFNFSDLFPHGVTVAFTVNPKPVNTSFPLIFSLGFTSFAIGADTDATE